MVDDPLHGLGGVVGVSAYGGPPDHIKSTKESSWVKLGVPPFGGSDVGGRAGKSGGVCPKEVEYGCTVYFDAANSGTL